MKLVQNGTITSTSRRRCLRGDCRLMKYASGKPSSRQPAVAETDSRTDRMSVSRYRWSKIWR
jgi:hypothetical protein